MRSGIYNFSQPSGLNLGQFPQQFLGLNKGLSEFDRPNDFTAAVLYRTTGNRWVRNFEIYPMLTAHNGLPLYIGQTNENAAQTGTNQQRPYDVNPSVSLYTAEVPNGTGVQYLLPASAANFPLEPTGPLFVGSGSSRTEVLTGRHRQLGQRRGSRSRTIGSQSLGRAVPLYCGNASSSRFGWRLTTR